LQANFRKRLGWKKIIVQTADTYDKVFDESVRRHYYFNKGTGEVTWDPPAFLGEVEMMTPRSFAAQQETEHVELRAVTTTRKLGNQKAAQDQATLERRQRLDEAGGLTRDQAASVLQLLWRKKKSRDRLVEVCRSIFKLEYDSESG
jgi:hypothetical protein